MARPRKDDGPSATERLENAFFQLLGTTPFRDITVSALVSTAKVNRNSFYYHFTDLDDLAYSAVSHLLISDIPRLIASGVSPDSERFDSLLAQAHEDGSLIRMLAVTGPHSTTALRNILEEAVAELWLSAFNLRLIDLEPQEVATLRYVLAGALSLVRNLRVNIHDSVPDADEAIKALTAFRRLPIIHANAHILADTLNSAAKRVVHSKPQPPSTERLYSK